MTAVPFKRAFIVWCPVHLWIVGAASTLGGARRCCDGECYDHEDRYKFYEVLPSGTMRPTLAKARRRAKPLAKAGR